MPKIKFVLDHKVRQADGKGPLYKVGQVVELSPESCLYFTSRGVGIDLPDEPPAVPEPPKAKGEGDGEAGAEGSAGATVPPPAPPQKPSGGKGKPNGP